MDIFKFRESLISDYKSYVISFLNIQNQRIKSYIDNSMNEGALWPEPLIQLNPSFEPGKSIDDLCNEGILHQDCKRIFKIKSDNSDANNKDIKLRLHTHQSNAVTTARDGHNYVLTTGTGSGKSLAYIIPIVDHILVNGSGNGIKAIIVYPMNALANSQYRELEKFINFGFPQGQAPVKFAKYTGQEKQEEREQILQNPPDILLTNYVMLELILTRVDEKPLIKSAQGLRFLVLDELHTYRGRQGADVAYLIRRVKQTLNAENLQFVGTSATLAGEGTFTEQQRKVATVASQLFGSEVKPENVIGETLKRITSQLDFSNPVNIKALSGRVADTSIKPPKKFDDFIKDPLSSWLESTFGLTFESESKRWNRAIPRSISGESGAAKELEELTGVSYERCVEVIQEGLLAGYKCEKNPTTGFPAFAFRLHQFISKGDTLYASLEDDSERHITIDGQQFVPGKRDKILLPIAFCRECGQEYYIVRENIDPDKNEHKFVFRELRDQEKGENSQVGFLYSNDKKPWPHDPQQAIERLPDDWVTVQNGRLNIKQNRREYVPQIVNVQPDGTLGPNGNEYAYISAPFRFCLNCNVSYGIRQRTDFPKLATLSSEGRSMATTILSLSTVKHLRADSEIKEVAKKLLSFTDNRQDASLQSGHFNDFIEIGWLRSALYKAVASKGTSGIKHDKITDEVFSALDLPIENYAVNPNIRFQARIDTDMALRNVIGYRLYRDLKRGWRVTSPNLEQSGLLEILYDSLTDLTEAEDVWETTHLALSESSPEIREKILKVLLDFMRRELAIKVDYLDPYHQERFKLQSNQHLISPWAIDEDERMERAAILYPRSGNQPGDYQGNVYLSSRGGFGLYLRRPTTFEIPNITITTEDTGTIITDLLIALETAGIVEVVDQHHADVPGYQLKASAIRWVAGDGTIAYHDPIRVPNSPDQGGRTNPFFVEYYKNTASKTYKFEAREHTAQVPYPKREEREARFREADLPIMFCSPTMELGVDIAELNIVNMRNIPPTPANYAQRSGRAGRSGQPALVFSYCSTGSSHDQFFFKRPALMVAGAVIPPRLDLANEDLVRAHMHAVWLSEASLRLGKSVTELLDLEGDDPSLELRENVQDILKDAFIKQRAINAAEQILHSAGDELSKSDWYSQKWLDEVFTQLSLSFETSINRWRELYRSARNQVLIQNSIILDVSRSADDRKRAQRLRREAEAQLKLLTEVENVVQSDFYSYRYFASEGFLPGYNFPRLPISAFIPGRRTKQTDEFLSRPRFLAISEFGPQTLVYHEGSKYIINKVIMPLSEDGELGTSQAKICSECGYLHPVTNNVSADICEICGGQLDQPLRPLFRLQNVSTKRRERINSDEEERTRLGYDLLTSIRFSEHGSGAAYQKAEIKEGNTVIAHLLYGHAATIWRVNLGWKRRSNPNQFGFLLDKERGYWERRQAEQDAHNEDPLSNRIERVIPFVEDRRNCMIFQPAEQLSDIEMASLQSALKNAIQVTYQLEDNELAVDPLPNQKHRRHILFYESSEGGAGVLRRLISDTQALSEVSKKALEICHYNPITGNDEKRAPGAREDCEAACYDCLMNYSNQHDHTILDRKSIAAYLLKLRDSNVTLSLTSSTRGEHLKKLLGLCESELEKKWLQFLEDNKFHLPDKAQSLIDTCKTRPDFQYTKYGVAIYVDGPHHDYPERQDRDKEQTLCLEDKGYVVIRFDHQDNWRTKVEQYPNIFGTH